MARAILVAGVGCLLCMGGRRAWAGGAQVDAAAYYALEMGGRLIGYARVLRTGARDGRGRQVEGWEAETFIKVALLGDERLLTQQSETLVDAATGRPLFYRATSVTGEDVRRVECEMDDEVARVRLLGEGDEQVAVQELPWTADTYLLDGNNFAHLALFARQLEPPAARSVAVTALVPSMPVLQELQLLPAGEREVESGGERVRCRAVEIAGLGLLLVDARTRDLVAFEAPAQDLNVRRADEAVVKLAQKMQAEEVLARRFCQSNVVFDDFLQVTYLKAAIDVRVQGEGLTEERTVLDTVMQSFTGERDASHVVGTVEVRTRDYDGRRAPPFPYPDEAGAERWLQPSPFIESDDAAIQEQARALTGTAQDSWDAVRRVAGWVHDALRYTIADTPSARRALATRAGDCGPHATLTVALLRAAGVPARLVGGLLYTPSFGGSFGQHAWVEVLMGEDGWIALDPTTGEWERLGATHIKLFEGLGGVIPASVEVLAFEPPPPAAPAAPARRGPLPWRLDRPYKVRYSVNGETIGFETFTISRLESDGRQAYRMESHVDLQQGAAAIRSHTVLLVDAGMHPLSFQAEVNAAGRQYAIEAAFEPRRVQQRITGAVQLSRTIRLPDDLYCFDNNLLGAWALLCAPLPYREGGSIRVSTYHPSSMRQLNLTFEVRALETLALGGQDLECFRCDLPEIKNTLWIARDGRFVRGEQGPLTFALEE